MQGSSGFFGKMVLFVFVVTLPSAIVAFWLANQDVLSTEYAILLCLTPVAPAVLVYNRLLREISSLTQRLSQSTKTPLEDPMQAPSATGGLLPTDDFLLTLVQYKNVLATHLSDAEESQMEATRLVNFLPDPMLVLNNRREIIHVNAEAQRFLGKETIEGDLSAYLRPPALIKAVDGILAGEFDNRTVNFEMAGEIQRSISAHVTIYESTAHRSRIIITLHDMTALKKTEQMRVDFIANASHELRTPLAILIGAIETLLGPAANDLEARQRFLDMMRAQSTRMSQLIDDLLSLSQIEMNEHARPSGTVDAREILQSVTHLLSTKAADLGKTIELDMPEDAVEVLGDKDQLHQVFTNLVDNALKYGKDNSSVDVCLSDKGARARVSVRDHGEGIPLEHIPRLTERFYRVDSDRSRKLGGTGLGLAIVKHIVSRHRGRLEIDSEVGKGSIFTVDLPRKEAVNPSISKVFAL